MALARIHRLPATAFRKVLTHGRAATGGSFFLRAVPNGASHIRLGISIPSRLVPRAVGRSRLRRTLHRVVDPVVKQRKVGYDVVMVLRQQEIATAPLYKDFLRALEKAIHE